MFSLPVHGGDIAGATKRFGSPADGWLDLSTGVNPFAYPLAPIDAALMRKLPDQAIWRSLRELAADYYRAPGVDSVVPVPGLQCFIRLLPRLRPLSRVAIVGPTYVEHSLAWSEAGHQVTVVETLERLGDADVVVAVNPNNPDGRRRDPGRLLEIGHRLALKDGLLIVDEAYGDLSPELSVASYAGKGLMVLRSFGKFFGLAGARLGFVIADLAFARQLLKIFDPWAISGPTLNAGLQALGDQDWGNAMRRRLKGEMAALDSVLITAGFPVLGGTSLFKLVSAPRAWMLYEYLGAQGVLTRPFADQPRWLRFGLPENEAGLDRLAAALAGFQQE